MKTNAVIPSLSQTWLADLGPDTPFGHFTVEITFESETQASFLVTGGAIEGHTETVDYTTTMVRDGLYVVRWTERASGVHVTRIEDYSHGTCMISSVIDGDFIQLHGTWSRIR